MPSRSMTQDGRMSSCCVIGHTAGSQITMNRRKKNEERANEQHADPEDQNPGTQRML